VIKDDDKDLIYELIYLDLIIEVLERDLIAIDHSRLKFKGPYKARVEEILKRKLVERRTKKDLSRKKGIKLFERKVLDTDFIDWPYIVRGYEGVQRIWTAAIRKQLNELLKELI